MKRVLNYLVVITVLMSALSFNSCKKDKDTVNEVSIVGRWNATKVEIKNDGVTETVLLDYAYIKLNANGTGEFRLFEDGESNIVACVYVYQNQVLTLNPPVPQEGDQPLLAKVIKLTETELVLSFDKHPAIEWDNETFYFAKVK